MHRSRNAPGATHVLVVDDEPAVRDVICLWLGRLGYRCFRAESVADAIRFLEQQTIDVVTSDITMPNRNGLELLKHVTEHYADTPVLMLTANVEGHFAIQALTLGAYGYLLKPLKRDEFLCQFSKALEHRRLLIENREYTTLLESKVREQTRVIRAAHEETIQRLVTASRFRDDETGGHIKRTGLFSALVAQALGWSSENVELIQMAAPMHDVGKVGIPDDILRKRGKLTDAEFDVMKTHALIGAKMLAGSTSPVLQMAERIAHFHHEKWNGTGYPTGLAGERIPLSARILSIVDYYDALTHDRVYRKAVPEEIVLEMIEQERGRHFDPMIVDAFMSTLPAIRMVNACELDHYCPEPSECPLLPPESEPTDFVSSTNEDGDSGTDSRNCLPVA